MDPQSDAATLEALSRRSSHCRLVLERHAHALREQFSLSNQLKKSVRQHPSAWFMGSLVSGLTLSRLMRSRSVAASTHQTVSDASTAARKPKSWTIKLLSSGIKLAQPALTAWLGRQLQQQWGAQHSPHDKPR